MQFLCVQICVLFVYSCVFACVGVTTATVYQQAVLFLFEFDFSGSNFVCIKPANTTLLHTLMRSCRRPGTRSGLHAWPLRQWRVLSAVAKGQSVMVVESPTKAIKIQKFLGDNFKVRVIDDVAPKEDKSLFSGRLTPS